MMPNSFNRRSFLSTTAAGTLAGLGDLSFLSALPAVADEQNKRQRIILSDDIEPIVRLIEDTPREELLEVFGRRIQNGLSYREVLAALLLAGVRNIEPRPAVGFKFHAVLVVNSAHLASLSSPPEHRWLPIFWALDYYKKAAADDVRERGDWIMSPVDDSALPPPHKAREAFIHAMNHWDEAGADAAIASLARSAGSNEISELFFQYGGRDFRSIGHKAIFVANGFRTLDCIGWEYSEPVLRSLAYALLMHEGGNPAERDDDADRPQRKNKERIAKIREDWQGGNIDANATRDLLSTLRTGSNDDSCAQVVEMLNAGVSPQSIWDALFVGAGELLMRQRGIVALHAVTTTNALAYSFRTSGDDDTRKMLLLQNAAFLPMFRSAMEGRGTVLDTSIDSLPASDPSETSVEAIFESVRQHPADASQRAFAFLEKGGDPKQLIDAARVLVYLKGDDAHDYKFSSAILEDCYHVSQPWMPQYLAANVIQLPGSNDRDNSLVQRTRQALA